MRYIKNALFILAIITIYPFYMKHYTFSVTHTERGTCQIRLVRK